MANLIDVGFAELHYSLFLGSKNFSSKLDPHRCKGLKLVYNKDDKELIVSWEGKVAHVPESSVAYYVPGKPTDRNISQVASPMVLGIAGSAQVETPMGHVHAGPGKGKTK